MGLLSEARPFTVWCWLSALLVFRSICMGRNFHSIIMVEYPDVSVSLQYHSGLFSQILGPCLHRTLRNIEISTILIQLIKKNLLFDELLPAFPSKSFEKKLKHIKGISPKL
jgi:hypothetical protein